jgi:tetratricopeptide (TPR) repeat protein
MGTYKLKNVKRPVEVFAIEADHLITPSISSIQGKGTRIKKSWLKKLVIPLLVLLSGIIGYSIYETFNGVDVDSFIDDRFAVMIFDNYTLKPELDPVGKMAADWVTQGLIETNMAKVVSFSSIGRYQKLINENPDASLKEITGADNFLSGRYSIDNDELVIEAFIKNGETDAVLENSSVVIRCPVDNPLQGIQELKQKILGYWVSKDELLTTPPSYDAYTEFLSAKEKYNLDWGQALSYVDKAIELDSNFFDALLMKIDILSAKNTDDSDASARELIAQVENRFPNLPKSAQDELNLFRAYIANDKISSYQYYYKIYERDPKDIYKNTSLAVLSLEGLNDADATIDILNEISDQSVSIEDPFYKQTRLSLIARAHIKNGNYKKAIRALDKFSRVDTTDRTIHIVRLKALAKMNDVETIDQFFRDLDGGRINKDYRYLYYSVAREFDLLGNQDLVNKYADQAIDLYSASEKPNKGMINRCKYLKKDFSDIIEYYSQNDRTASLAYLGGIYAQSGNQADALKIIQQLKAKPDKGRESYEIGRIYALLGETDQAIDHLKNSFKGDRWFTLFNFENDPDLKGLFELRKFKEVTNYYLDQIDPS